MLDIIKQLFDGTILILKEPIFSQFLLFFMVCMVGAFVYSLISK